MINKIACTGHRPNKLFGGYSEYTFNILVEFAAQELLEENADVVISGMALGWDQAVAQASLNLNIKLICAIPFRGQELRWPSESVEKYNTILKSSYDIKIISSTFSINSYQNRNIWMVDNCTSLLALWNGTNGGTNNCIKYAKTTNKPIKNLWEKYVECFDDKK